MINGIKNQVIKTISPAMATKICRQMPIIIKTILIAAPKILETVLDISVLKNSATSNPLG